MMIALLPSMETTAAVVAAAAAAVATAIAVGVGVMHESLSSE